MSNRFVLSAGALLIATLSSGVAAQQCNPGGAGARDPRVILPNARYDGRYAFVRIAYSEGMYGGGFGGRREPFWHHDYPDADQHFPRLLGELSKIRTQVGSSLILRLDDPELAKFPVAYLTEPGHWGPSDAEVLGMRNYLKKGGFVIFDDFSGNEIYNLTEQMNKVLPGMKLIELSPAHPIFDSFYRVKSLDFYHPYYCMKSIFYGIFVDNDPQKRMMAIVNYNNDVGEYWEWSDLGFFGTPSNEAYKLGINYLIYAMTR